MGNPVGAIGQRLNLRLFLEGIEIPIIGAQIQMNLNAPATASIQVIPVDTITELKPRTMVHLFYWDFNYDLPSRTDFDSAVSARTDALDPDVQLDNYKLIYGGEVVGLVMSKTPVGRAAVLQCADWSTYWDTSYQTFISWSPTGNWMGDNSSMWSGANNMFNSIMSSHSSVMSSHLRRRPKTEGLQNVTGLMGGIISLLEAMGGVDKHVSGINDYFTIAEIKNHLMQQITADQTDNTSLKLFDNKAFSNWLNKRTTHLGELVSFRDMLKLLFKWIYYEVVPITAPMFVPARISDKVQRRVVITDLSAGSKRALRNARKITRRYDGFEGRNKTLKRQIEDAEVQLAIKVGGEIKGVMNRDGKMKESTKKILRHVVDILRGINTVSRGPSLISNAEIIGVNIEKLTENRQDKSSLARVRKLYKENRDTWRRATAQISKALGVPERVDSRINLDRLQTQIFRPDCFFVAPPKCNVLFPDQITAFQYQRNFLQEITRLRLTTGTMFTSGAGGGFFQNAHLAPNKEEIRRIARSQGNKGIRTLLPWEIYTGILPKFEHIAEVNYISNNANRKKKKVSKNLRGKGKAYAQRAAYFNFIKYRFAPRSISVTAKFSPQFVLGFPALIIDKPYILEPEIIQKGFTDAGVSGNVDTSIGSILANISGISAVFRSPTQYLGMPAGLSHNIDQKGGITSTTLTHARVHKISDDDYLDSLLVEVIKGLNTTIKTTELDAVELLAKGDYEKLELLIRCTPQAAILQRLEQIKRGENPDVLVSVEAKEFQSSLSSRPSSSISLNRAVLSTLPRITATANLKGRLVKVSSTIVEDLDALNDGVAGEDADFRGTRFVRITGGTAESVFLGTSTTIFEPSPYGPVGRGSKGPNKGIIKHVQVTSNGVLSVSSADINGFARSKKQKKKIRRRKRRGGDPDTFFLWRKVIIHEEVTSRRTIRSVPIEEALRPPWFSAQYSNLFIGEDIYKPFFGIGSIVDQSLFLSPNGSAFLGDRTFDATARSEMMGRVQAANGDLKTIMQVLDDFKARGVGTMPSIEESVDALAFLYGEVRRQGLDVQKFIANYTDRPIATMRNIFGSLDLRYGIQEDGTLAKISGEAGFHSTAVAPFGDLLGLVDNPDLEIARIRSKGKKFPLSRALDPRPGRREKVQAYIDQIGSSGVSLGSGLLG